MSAICAPIPISADWPDPLRWAAEFLPDYFTDPPAQFHVDLFSDLAASERRLIARVAPRGHAKSTCAALAFPLWCICEQRCHNIVIITHEASLARQFVCDLRRELESNERILATYGELCRQIAPVVAQESTPRPTRVRIRTSRKKSGTPRKPVQSTKRKPRPARVATAVSRRSPPPRRARWSQSVFTTATGITVQAKSVGAALRGARVGPHRPDLIICDDIEKDETVATPEGRRKLEHWLRRVVLPALAPHGRLVLLGSLLHYDSLLANLRDPRRFPGWDYRVYRALEARRNSDGRFELESLWPARWPVSRLHEERSRVGTLAFEQEYMANPIDHSLRVFRPEWLRRYDEAELEHEQLVNLMAVDPATGVSGGDYFALWVGSVHRRSGVIYTRVLALERIGVVEQIKRIIAAFELWRPLRIGIETTAYQAALKDVLDEHSRQSGFYMPIVPIHALANKRARIEGSAAHYENGTFRLPAILPPEVESQFLHFPKARHDDAPDVCAMGIELARSLRTLGGVDGAWRETGNPYVRRGGW